MNILTSVLWVAALAGTATHPAGTAPSPLEQVFDRPAAVAGKVSRFNFPRTDLHVTVGEVTVDPALALTSWVAFEPLGKDGMMMGDLVLRDTEVAPVMERLLAGGVEITALHNHLLGESPRLFFLHFWGYGGASELARGIRAALERTNSRINR